MQVKEVMSKETICCRTSDNLHHAAQVMWSHDYVALPVIDDDARLVAMLTDRDICVAAYAQGRRLLEIVVASAQSHGLHTCGPEDSVESVERLMCAARIRHVPVIDADGRLIGVVSLGDLARHAECGNREVDRTSYENIVRTLAKVSVPRGADRDV